MGKIIGIDLGTTNSVVATVIDGCVGCGLCGENAHAAVLCPSFYRAEVVQNPNFLDRALQKVRNLLT